MLNLFSVYFYAESLSQIDLLQITFMYICLIEASHEAVAFLSEIW